MSRTDIVNLLEDCGVLATPQRVEIAEILLARPQHLSAEQVMEHLSERSSSVSKATVYNTLNRFAECGIVRELNVDPTRKYYDSTTHAHHHFYNVDTGELTDIPADQVELASVPALPEGTTEAGIDVVIRVRRTR